MLQNLLIKLTESQTGLQHCDLIQSKNTVRGTVAYIQHDGNIVRQVTLRSIKNPAFHLFWFALH